MMKCPGCSKHCCEDAPRCKYGRNYFAKQQEKKQEPKTQFKWEANVIQGGLIWKLLYVNRKVKKAVCRGVISENSLMAALSTQEQAVLYEALEKLEKVLPAKND